VARASADDLAVSARVLELLCSWRRGICQAP
jgi:hypothetical protein